MHPANQNWPSNSSGRQEFFRKAEVAHLVEHDLAKVGVAGSSPVFRSVNPLAVVAEDFFFNRPGGGIGRHAGLKILWPLRLCGFKSRSGYFLSHVNQYLHGFFFSWVVTEYYTGEAKKTSDTPIRCLSSRMSKRRCNVSRFLKF